MLKAILVAASVLFTSPVGESGRFVRNPDLSSSIILDARVDVDIVAADAVYATVELDCAFRVRFIGNLGGGATEFLPLSLFNGELLDRLRREGEITEPLYTAHYQGTEAITLQNGLSYTAEKIKLDGIDISGQEDHPCFQRAVRAMAKVYDAKAAVSNLVITGYVAEGQPLGGLVRVIVSGRASGVNFVAGLDKE